MKMRKNRHVFFAQKKTKFFREKCLAEKLLILDRNAVNVVS